MTTWTIRADDVLDKLVEENVRILGYTSKAELVREAVRDFILRRNMGRFGLLTLDHQRKAAAIVNPQEALKRLASITEDPNLVDQIMNEERELIEKALLKVIGDDSG